MPVDPPRLDEADEAERFDLPHAPCADLWVDVGDARDALVANCRENFCCRARCPADEGRNHHSLSEISDAGERLPIEHRLEFVGGARQGIVQRRSGRGAQ
jgi:hypothetical protein